MDNISEIPNEQFFSFKDEDGFIYGFDILSIHNLIYKCNGAIKIHLIQKQLVQKLLKI